MTACQPPRLRRSPPPWNSGRRPWGMPLGDEGVVGAAGRGGRGAELRENGARVLPGPGHPAEEGAVAGPGVPVQRAEIGDDRRPERVQVEVAHEFEEVRLLLHHDGLVAVLEEMARALVAAVEGAGVAGEEAPHAPGERAAPGADQEVGVVGEERPGVDGEGAVRRQGGQAGDEVRAVRVVAEDGAALEAPHHHVVEGPRGIEAGLAWHSEGDATRRRFQKQRPVIPAGAGRLPCCRAGAWHPVAAHTVATAPPGPPVARRSPCGPCRRGRWRAAPGPAPSRGGGSPGHRGGVGAVW